MISFAIKQPELASIRFAISPIWECVASIRALRCVPAHPESTGWIRRIQKHAPRASDLRVDHLVRLITTRSAYLADFIAPPPDSAEPSFEAELQAVRRTPARVVSRELRRSRITNVHATTAIKLRETVAEELDAWWHGVIEPEWSAMRALLRRDIATRATALAMGGPLEVLGALDPGVRLDERELTIEGPRSVRRLVRDDTLLLVPSIFGWPNVFVVADSPWRLTIAYPARGVAAESVPPSAANEGLEWAFGRMRSRVLAASRRPVSTSELAQRLRISPAAASDHLMRLRRAGLISSVRSGRFILYQTTSRGAAVLDAFGRD